MAADNHVHVAVVGNPNCGKTTLFNAVTGSKLKVANWPGVTAVSYTHLDAQQMHFPWFPVIFPVHSSFSSSHSLSLIHI